jgi:hypothetical protein
MLLPDQCANYDDKNCPMNEILFIVSLPYRLPQQCVQTFMAKQNKAIIPILLLWVYDLRFYHLILIWKIIFKCFDFHILISISVFMGIYWYLILVLRSVLRFCFFFFFLYLNVQLKIMHLKIAELICYLYDFIIKT